LGVQPPANNFVKEGEDHSGYVPLAVEFCPRCTLGQLSVVVDPVELYRNYSYVTSTSQTMQDHFRRLWHDVNMDAGREIKTVLEIGSNDGLLLRFMADQGAKVVGIDPAENLAPECQKAGVDTVTGFFDAVTAKMAVAILGSQPDLIVARHVMCHIDDWKGFIGLIEATCGPDTLVVIEVPYVVDTLNSTAFDLIYHEHLSYMSVTAMRHLLRDTRLCLAHLHQYRLHGGSIALVLRRGSMDPYENFERPLTVADWGQFASNSFRSIQQLSQVVRSLRLMGHTVSGFGAAAKSTVWINACGFTADDLDFVTDTTKWKQGKFIPGTNIPVVDQGALMRDVPNYAVMFCWNYCEEVLKGQRPYMEAGGQFIIPVPFLNVTPPIRP
jgi:2-polyprenyl-3-methyl-5-hydroxy-6-metoxy-1,4-benzoquinol methylase